MKLRILFPLSFSGICLLAIIFLIPTAWAGTQADPSIFPSYPEIKHNVIFWENVYAKYSVNTAIIHDQEDLSRVYAAVKLIDSKKAGSQKKNSRRIKNAKKHYKKILHALSSGKRPVNKEEIRVASLFRKNVSQAELKKAANNIRAQTGLKERFTEGVIRSGAYMRELKSIFRQHGLPQDLAYLPHVESSFNPNAFSKFGAAGMWQFTRSTGKEFLRIDYIVDERRDPLISADAAARLLKKNFQLLGSWPLALTAYNYGAAGMKRALDQEGNYQNIFKNYRKGYFKFASRNFYSEFLAAVQAAKKQEQSGLLKFNKPKPTISIRLPAYADATRLSKHLRLDIRELKRYNPSLRQPVLNGTKYIPKDFQLKLPYHYKTSKLLTSAPASIFFNEQKRSKFYRVQPGDTAGAIALAHNISLKSLVSANHLNSKAVIRVGQNLRIPDTPNVRSSANVPSVQKPRDVVIKENKKYSPEQVKLVFQEDFTVSGNLQVFGIKRKDNLLVGRVEVQPDESIGIFADWLKVTPESIRLTNNIPTGKDIHPGQLVSLEFLKVKPEDFESFRFDFHQETQEDFFESYSVVGMMSYEILEGDTVWDICYKKFDLPLWLLKKYNDSLDYNRLDSSGILQIPIIKEI